MRVVLYTSAGVKLLETEVQPGDGRWAVDGQDLPDIWLWNGRAFIRNDMYLKLTGSAGYVEATVGTLPARED